MPRVRIVCQHCQRELSYLEIAPRWTVRAACPVCRAVTTARLDEAGNVRLTIESAAAVATGAMVGKRRRENGRKAG